MNKDYLSEQINNCLKHGEISDALKHLEKLVPAEGYKDVLLIYSRLSFIEKQYSRGLILETELSAERQKITLSIFKLVKSVLETYKSKPFPTSTDSEKAMQQLVLGNWGFRLKKEHIQEIDEELNALIVPDFRVKLIFRSDSKYELEAILPPASQIRDFANLNEETKDYSLLIQYCYWALKTNLVFGVEGKYFWIGGNKIRIIGVEKITKGNLGLKFILNWMIKLGYFDKWKSENDDFSFDFTLSLYYSNDTLYLCNEDDIFDSKMRIIGFTKE